ncbi:MAG TPA: ATP-binding protein [Pseudomonadales bacterium]|jgi:two-component system sensor histidine kinase ChvG|nr:ATP-binding protein [Pseudomonadales bacterium]
MKIGNRIRGPRLGTKLMLWGLVLLIVPWISYRQLIGMERLLIQGQSQAQLLTAEGISTLFNGREDLFNDLPVRIEDYESLYARPLQNPIRIDGKDSDWEPDTDKFIKFGADAENNLTDGGFKILLGERGGQLYALMRIKDDVLVYRNPEYLRLDNADSVRLNFIQDDGEDGRVVITFTGPGVTTAYRVGPEWKLAVTGVPENQVQGHMERTPAGIDVEFRMPLTMLGSRKFFGLSYVDVDDPESRAVRAITQTLPTAGKSSFNLVVLRSPEVLNIIQGLGYSGARILVIDAQNRVRAETGSFTMSEDREAADPGWASTARRWFDVIRPVVHRLVMWQRWDDDELSEDSATVVNKVIESSLRGNPIALRCRVNDQEIIMAAHPIVSRDAVLGGVVVEQNIADILAFQRAALEQVIVLSLVSLLVVFVVLVAFAGRLAWRIRQLRREASAAIDPRGRLRANALQSAMNAGDEIGDLARSVSGLLAKLQQHNQFLENMPRTLRHEINNPLNTLSTSLQNLADENPEVRDSKYLDSAKRGVMRIGAIVQNLADAANLEESLEAEELEIVDLEQLIESYVANCRVVHKDCEFAFRGTGHPVYARVSDYRIEQLLDKIIDNAIDFHRPNSPIKVQLDQLKDFLRITVANRGPTLPPAAEETLFDSMVSHRGAEARNRLHFGLGLYVVRVIAEHHGGSVRGMNLPDGSGVVVIVQLPLANLAVSPARTNGEATTTPTG